MRGTLAINFQSMHSEPSEALFGQLKKQTCGWKESLTRIRETVQRRGAYHGILAFSQGCAMALLLLATAELASLPHPTSCLSDAPSSLRCSSGDVSSISAHDMVHKEPAHTPNNSSLRSNHDIGDVRSTGASEHFKQANNNLNQLSEDIQREVRLFGNALAQHSSTSFKFALMFSGHRGVCPEAQHIIEAARPLATPSMHVYGSLGQDRQVPYEESAELPALFQTATVVVHNKGHVVPSSKADCQLYLEFATAAMS
jgi:hypothetical protein